MITRSGLHSKKVLMFIWRDWKERIYYELLPQGEIINSVKYYSQLEELKEEQIVIISLGSPTSSSILSGCCTQTIEFLERFHYAERWRKYKGTTKDTTVIESESNKKLVKFSLTRSNYTEKQHSFEILIIWEIGQKLVKYWFEDVFFAEVERLSSKSAMLIA
uniref:Uncharacterized protein n=1 Tax=Vespula pensylvanica TaxID=30213 RepID=A0A834JYW0_VESPE|nr:hypothetical protein H0235_016715 [Vespula pensylvanica]